MKEHKKSIGQFSRILQNRIKRILDKMSAESGVEGITGLHHMVIGFIEHSEGKDVFQKDIEERFNVRRSTASGILSLMEKNELIVRESVVEDARLKKIVLTPKAYALHEDHWQKILQMEAGLEEGLSKEELETFFIIAEKILENAKRMEGAEND